MRLLALDSQSPSQREENRRALLRLYSFYTIQYAAFALILTLAVVGEMALIGSPSLPQFVVYPLILITVIPAILSFYSMIHWWRIQSYTLSLPLDAIEGDSLAALHVAYRDYADERSPRLITEGMNKMNGRRIALLILIVFLISLPVSYIAISSQGFAILVLIAATSFALGALAVLLIPPLASRAGSHVITKVADSSVAGLSEGDNNKGLTDEILNVLSLQAEQLRQSANEHNQLQLADRGQPPTQVSLGDLPERVVAEINGLAAFKNTLLPDQRETLTRVATSLTSTIISLGLPAEAARVYSAYRAIIPG